MFRWLKRKCARKHSKRLRTSSISDLTRSHDYTRHPDTNIYHEIDDEHVGLAYAITSLVDMIPPSFPEVCPICRHQCHGSDATCKCLDPAPTSPFEIRRDLADGDDFSWLEYDFMGSNLHRFRSEMKRRVLAVKPDLITAYDSSSSGFYETDDSCDDVLTQSAHPPTSAPKLPHRSPNSPTLTPKMGCKIIKRTQSAINTSHSRTLRKSHSDYLSPLKVTSIREDDEMFASNCSNGKDTQHSDYEEDIFDHLYANVCIDINNLEIPKLRKSSYKSRGYGQNRLLNDLLKMNYDQQTNPSKRT